MNYLVPLSVLGVVACAGALEPLAVMVQRRRSAYPVYASDFMQEYEPYAVAAFPVHAPLHLPLLQVLAPAPAAHASQLRKRAKRPQGVRAGDLHAYASDVEYAYAYEQELQPGGGGGGGGGGGNGGGGGSQLYEQYEEDAPVVVYARPNKGGGYSYRKPSAPIAAASSHGTHRAKEPIIIRIHKYRVIH